MILVGDVRDKLAEIPDGSVRCCVTSPPYWRLRDYGVDGQLGLEETPDDYTAALVDVFRDVRRVLTDDGTLWLNLGDSWAGSWGAQGRTGSMADRSVVSARQIEAHPKKASRTGSIPMGSGLKPKDLVGIPWLVAFALRADGWWLRDEIIWRKKNPMPSSVTDRTTRCHEQVFLLSKSARYFYDADAIAEKAKHAGRVVSYDGTQKNTGHENGTYPGAKPRDILVGGTRNRRSVWTINTKPFPEAHFATFPLTLPMLCIQAGSETGDTVLDPFAGAGTTGVAATKLGRDFIGVELNPEYAAMAERRIMGTPLALEFGA